MPDELHLSSDEVALIEHSSPEAIFNHFVRHAFFDEEKRLINVVILFINIFLFFNKVTLSDACKNKLSRTERLLFSEASRQFIFSKIEIAARRVKDEVLFQASHASVKRLRVSEAQQDQKFWCTIYCLAIYKGCNLADANLKMEVIDWFIRIQLPQASTLIGWKPFKKSHLPFNTYRRVLLFHDVQRQQFKSNLFSQAYSCFVEGLYVISLQHLNALNIAMIDQHQKELTREAQVSRELEKVVEAISTLLYDNLDKTTANQLNAEVFQLFKTLRARLEMQAAGFDSLELLAGHLKSHVTKLIDSMGSINLIRKSYQSEIEAEESQDLLARLLVR